MKVVPARVRVSVDLRTKDPRFVATSSLVAVLVIWAVLKVVADLQDPLVLRVLLGPLARLERLGLLVRPSVVPRAYLVPPVRMDPRVQLVLLVPKALKVWKVHKDPWARLDSLVRRVRQVLRELPVPLVSRVLKAARVIRETVDPPDRTGPRVLLVSRDPRVNRVLKALPAPREPRVIPEPP